MFSLSSANFLLFIPFFLPSFAYVITTQPWQTDRPAPGLTLFYDIQVQQSDDVVLVDILLFNGSLGNTTVIFGNSDLTKQDDRNAGFDIPFVPPGTTYALRLVETSTKRFLQDSPPFQIFAVGSAAASTSPSPSSIPPTTLPMATGLTIVATRGSVSISPLTTTAPSTLRPEITSTTASSSTTLFTAAAAPLATIGASKSSNVGAIVGGVIGGVLIIVAVLALILWRRRSSKFISTNGTEKALPKVAPEGRLGSIQPFVLHPDNAAPVEVPVPNGVDAVPFPLSPGIDNADKAGPLPKKFARGYPTQMETGDTGSNNMSARAEMLRQERERINREIASLENRSTVSDSRYGGSSSGTELSDSSSHPLMASVPPIRRGGDIHDQLASLREQIRQIEQTYAPSALVGVSDEPPPGYEGPPSGSITGALRPNATPVGQSFPSILRLRPDPEMPIGDREEG